MPDEIQAPLKRSMAPLCWALLIGALASLQWLFQYSYSRGYDFFLWIYNAWVFNRAWGSSGFPDWSSFSAAGHPFFKIAALSDCVVLAILSYPLGPFVGTKVFVLLFYLLAAAGTFVLTRCLTRDPLAGVVSAAGYAFSWFLTFNVYFQAYLSNFMSYALFPWLIYCFYLALEKQRKPYAVAAGVLLSLSITSNPQVAIKLLLLGSVWMGLAYGVGRLWSLAFNIVVIGGIGIWLAFFNLVSALQLRPEVVSGASRLNSFQSPLEFFLMPMYGVNLLLYELFSIQFFQVSLQRVLYSGYPGISVVIIALLAWGRSGRKRDRHVFTLWGITGGSCFIYWFVMGFLPASSWVGISHNLLIYPALCSAVLCGFGTLQVRQWVVRRWGEGKSWLGAGALVSLILADLGTASFFLNKYGTTHTYPAALPEVRAWEVIEEKWKSNESESRFYTYNPDHTIYLFPVLTDRPTANVIELRQRSPEYQSYLDFIDRQLKREEGKVLPGKLLALLNVGFVDVPSKAFIYQGAGELNGPYDKYMAGLDFLDSDPDLTRIYERYETFADLMPERHSTDIRSLYNPHSSSTTTPRLAQVVYANEGPLPGFIPKFVVAVVGNTLEGEKLFEEIAGAPVFVPDYLGFLLVNSLESLSEQEKAVLSGYYASEAEPRTDLRRLSIRDILELYQAADSAETRIEIHRKNADGVEIALEPAQREVFLFVSYQHFKAWMAYDRDDHRLQTYKAGAGLTAVFLPAATTRVSLQFETSRLERWARLVSFGGVCGVMGYIGYAALRERDRPKRKGLIE